MRMRFYQLLTFLVLLILAIVLSYQLFQHWQNVPTENLSAWRMEYATLELEENSEHILRFQVRVDNPTKVKFTKLPHVELLLTNPDGETIAYRNFRPQDWIAKNIQDKTTWLIEGVPSGVEISSEMSLEVPPNASGFQIHLLYR